mmetsp:Transcript_22809/g.46926  ORF Transcript_22809/g.46926 Transcript_22809/m.46926 type:complete len:263 (-) Transcript_22809:225-1013(-)
MIVAARAINGASGGTVGIANAYIADATTSEEKSVYISYLQACNSIGIIVGPALGGVLSHLGFSVACYVSAGLSGLNLVIGVTFLTEAKPRGNQAREAGASLTAAKGGTAQDEEGAGTQVAAEESRGAAASRLQARQTSADTGLDYIPWSAGLLFGAGPNPRAPWRSTSYRPGRTQMLPSLCQVPARAAQKSSPGKLPKQGYALPSSFRLGSGNAGRRPGNVRQLLGHQCHWCLGGSVENEDWTARSAEFPTSRRLQLRLRKR